MGWPWKKYFCFGASMCWFLISHAMSGNLLVVGLTCCQLWECAGGGGNLAAPAFYAVSATSHNFHSFPICLRDQTPKRDQRDQKRDQHEQKRDPPLRRCLSGPGRTSASQTACGSATRRTWPASCGPWPPWGSTARRCTRRLRTESLRTRLPHGGGASASVMPIY